VPFTISFLPAILASLIAGEDEVAAHGRLVPVELTAHVGTLSPIFPLQFQVLVNK
jgi:hypothetical protein